MVIKLHNLKILLSLLSLSHSTISNFYQSTNWDFWGLVIPLNFVLETARNYVSIIITIVSNITVFVSHNVLCFQYFMPISHCINKKASPTHCVYWGLSPSLKYFLFFAKHSLKSATYPSPHFQAMYPQYIDLSCTPLKIRFFNKLAIASYLHICIASYLASHDIVMLKITSCCCFFGF